MLYLLGLVLWGLLALFVYCLMVISHQADELAMLLEVQQTPSVPSPDVSVACCPSGLVVHSQPVSRVLASGPPCATSALLDSHLVVKRRGGRSALHKYHERRGDPRRSRDADRVW